jgi:hypothetical protein
LLVGSWVGGYQFSRKTALRIFLIFCMNVPYYKGKKRTRRFFQKNSGSLIIHENVSKNEEKKLPKKIENFFGQTVFGF